MSHRWDMARKRKAMATFLTFDPDPTGGGSGLAQITETTQTVEVSFCLPNGKTGWVQIAIQPEPDFLHSLREPSEADKEPRWILSMRAWACKTP